jgi:hypothetical protein
VAPSAVNSHGGALPFQPSRQRCRAAPERKFIGCVEIVRGARDWTPAEAELCPGDSSGGVLLARFEEWDPPVPMSSVLSNLDPPGNARADFDTGVVRITAGEYLTAHAVAAARDLT